MSDKNDMGGSLGETDFIDSVKEIDLNIRSHRDDDDFEKMLAQLNKKPEPAREVQEEHDDGGHEETAPEPPHGNDCVPAMAEIAEPEPESGAETKTETEEKEIEPWERPIFENIDSVWDNPRLSGGGRISMNIKTDFRREVTITVPVRTEPEPEPNPKHDTFEWSPFKPEKPEDFYEPEFEDGTIEMSFAEALDKTKTIPKTKPKPEQNLMSRPRDTSAVPGIIDGKARARRWKKRFEVLNSAVCMAAVICTGFYLLVCVRDMTGFPNADGESVLDGSYFEQLSDWYERSTPEADGLKAFSDGFSRLFGAVPEKETESSADTSDSDGANDTADSAEQTESETQTPSSSLSERTDSEAEELSDDYYDGKFSGKAVAGMDNVGETALNAMRRAIPME